MQQRQIIHASPEPQRRRGTSQKLTNRTTYVCVTLRDVVRSFAPLRMTAQLDRFGSRRYFRCGKELVSENRGIDRILRRLKLHAESRQFGGQNS
jgi:hypothetical protein